VAVAKQTLAKEQSKGVAAALTSVECIWNCSQRLQGEHKKAMARDQCSLWCSLGNSEELSHGPCMIAHPCNASYSRGRDQELPISRPAQAKSYQDPISTNYSGVVVCTCHPSYWRSIGRKITI
jgi:hypothetical protein